VAPFALLALANFLLIYYLISTRDNLTASSIAERKSRKFNAINRTVMLVTFLFIAMTLPNAIISFNYGLLMQSYAGTILVLITNCFTFSYHASSIVILYLSNYKFRKELKAMLTFSESTHRNSVSYYKTRSKQNMLDDRTKSKQNIHDDTMK
jgi:hypothetical protein